MRGAGAINGGGGECLSVMDTFIYICQRPWCSFFGSAGVADGKMHGDEIGEEKAARNLEIWRFLKKF